METPTGQPQKIYLKDYRAPESQIETTELFFELFDDVCRVKAALTLVRTEASARDLKLDGVGLEIEAIFLDGQLLTENRYQVDTETLKIFDVPDRFCLETTVRFCPKLNTSLEGLYKSQGLFTTQCEAQGFRKITYFLDRPDVMSLFTVTIEADQKTDPVLLSNGDLVSSRTLDNGRHSVTWKDPFKKPCYLFALVAGDLGVLNGTFQTMSGRQVNLQIFSRYGTQDRCQFALESLKKSMRWDEDRFGREYDLATYMIVAVDDFNAGAMENKGLNIFNSRLVLADPKTATDQNYFSIESVIAHEYFHNWTGNRVTLRDWFHLSLKEGLTVFRDQEFSMDLHSRPMIRIDTVSDLREGQFAEDAGPNAHPIRPEACYAVDNFFTSTIYEKGAEVIRMMQTMVGRPGFRQGMDVYFDRYDGKAVVIEDFASAIADINHQDWSQFKRWYSQAGTPAVHVTERYWPELERYVLELEQSCAPTPGQPTKEDFHIPFVFGLLDTHGQDIGIKNAEVVQNTEGQNLLHLKQKRQVFTFENLSERPVLSLNRGFSAPVHLQWDVKQEDLLFLLSHDSDAFNRWESAKTLMIRDLANMIQDIKVGRKPVASGALLSALGLMLVNNKLDLDLKAKLLVLPSDAYLAQLEPVYIAETFQLARQTWENSFAQMFEQELLQIYKAYHGKNDQSLETRHMSERTLKNTALGYLTCLPQHENLALTQFRHARHMTDSEAALCFCLDLGQSTRDEVIKTFHQAWKDDSLTMNKWFALQAGSRDASTAQVVKNLWDHPDFNSRNPNRVYSLLGRFGDNLVRFHEGQGVHYGWFAEKVYELDRINPQVATRIAGAFDLCSHVPHEAAERARAALERILNLGLSKNTYEIVSKITQSLKTDA